MRKAIVAGLLSASLIAGCTGDPPPDDPSSSTVTVENGGEVSTGSVTVRIPPRAVDQDGELSAATVDEASLPDQGALPKHLAVVGDPVEVELSGAKLTSPASVEFALDASAKQQLGESPPFVVWQDAKGGWRLLPARMASKDTVVAKTDHFSFGFLASIDISAWGEERAEDLRDYVTGRAGAEQPNCGDESTPREQGATVTSDGGDGIKWCYGIESGSTVLKVTNNRRTFVTVQYPPSWTVRNGNSVSITLDTAARALGDWVGEFARGRDARVIDGGETLTLVVPEGGGGRVTAETDFLAWTLGALSFGVGVYSGVAQGVGLNAASGAQDRLLAALAGDAPSDGYLAALQGCGKELVNAFGELDDLDVTDAAGQSAKFLWGCVPRLMQADIAATGVSMFGLGLILEAVGTAASLVLTAVHLIVTGSREIWDNLAALGGNSDPVYDIVVAPPRPESRVAKTGAGEHTLWFTHPTWGPVRLVTNETVNPNGSPTLGRVTLRVIDTDGQVRYSFSRPYLWELLPASAFERGSPRALEADVPTSVDARGNVFIYYNPGRYNGVIVLRPTATGFDDLGTIPSPNTGRFYYAFAVDQDGDESYEIQQFRNDCTPSCAEGAITQTILDWTGSDYS